MIRAKGMIATWDDAERSWVSDDDAFERFLNDQIPDDVYAVDTPFRKGGVQGEALRGLLENSAIGKDIEIVKQTEPETPPEQPGDDF